ncbi:hypothetical protein HZS_2580 [Henneguya salminicola]|nr:hypothetical protein HZS_2580 [Henneguya salminicola]
MLAITILCCCYYLCIYRYLAFPMFFCDWKSAEKVRARAEKNKKNGVFMTLVLNDINKNDIFVYHNYKIDAVRFLCGENELFFSAKKFNNSK